MTPVKSSFDKMTQREMLLLLNQKFDRMNEDFNKLLTNQEKDYDEVIKRIASLEMDVIKLKTKIAIWASIIGTAAGILTTLITKILNL